MRAIKVAILSLCCFQITACATAEKSRELITVSGLFAGAAIGALSAPADERADLHAVYWGGLAGTASALIANRIYNDESEKEKQKLEIDKLKADLDLIQNAKMVLLKTGHGNIQSAIPGSNKTSPNSSKVGWRLYKVDQWIPESDKKVIHQDMIIEVDNSEKGKSE